MSRTELGHALVSTVFLGTDHNWSGQGPPILFETMVFGLTLKDCQWRCSTWAEAELQHARVVKLAMDTLAAS